MAAEALSSLTASNKLGQVVMQRHYCNPDVIIIHKRQKQQMTNHQFKACAFVGL